MKIYEHNKKLLLVCNFIISNIIYSYKNKFFIFGNHSHKDILYIKYLILTVPMIIVKIKIYSKNLIKAEGFCF